MKRLKLNLALLFALFLYACLAAATQPSPIVSKYIYEIFHHDTAELITSLKDAGVNTVATPIAWSVAELQPGEYDFSPYVPALDALAENGLHLLIILDSSGRKLLDANGLPSGFLTLPGWITEVAANPLAVDFSDNRTPNLDYHDSGHWQALARFYHQAVDFFSRRYGDKIIAYVPGITAELEIKYPQEGYRWQSYSDAAQTGFNAWLRQRGIPAADLPIPNFNNNLASGRPALDPLFPELMRYREATLRRYVCDLAELIRQGGGNTFGYFGQMFTSHDAIYALGIIEEVVACFDMIAVDFNFHDGYQIQLNPYVVPLMVNYARHLGYERIIGGIYLEKLRNNDGKFVTDHTPVIQKTIELLSAEDALAGIEIGNLSLSNLPVFNTFGIEALTTAAERDTPRPQHQFKVGLVASKWTFYLWHGEHSNDRNIIQDVLLSSYIALREAGDFEVAILGEKALIEGNLEAFDALILPHQTTLSQEAREAIRSYYQTGGRLVQDVRFGEFGADGRPRGDWEDQIFGIAGRNWQYERGRFRYQGERLTLPRQDRAYFSHVLLLPAPGHELAMPAVGRSQQGLILRGPRTLTFGFLPQLTELTEGSDEVSWRDIFVEEIRKLIEGGPR